MPTNRNYLSQKKGNATAFSESRWSVMNFLRSLDIFGLPLPAFNIKGKDKV